MNLAEALAQTATERGPQSNLDKLLHDLDPTMRTEVQAALNDTSIQAKHLSRALTKIAKARGVLTGDKAAVSVESINKWRNR